MFLFDEPLSNLDAKLRTDLRVELKRLHKKLKNTMIYATHDQVEAMTLADRISIMRGGMIEQLDAPETIYAKPCNKYVADFIGSPAMNLFEGHLKGNTFSCDGFIVDVSSYEFGPNSQRDGATWLGTRPEHIVTADAAAGHTFSGPAEIDIVDTYGLRHSRLGRFCGPIRARAHRGPIRSQIRRDPHHRVRRLAPPPF